MIYSKVRKEHFIPRIDHVNTPYQNSKFHRYFLTDGRTPIGYVNLIDEANGVKISMIKNYDPKLYKDFEITADQIEIEHCLKRGISPENIEINSEAVLNSHAYHSKIGKVFRELPDGPFKSYLIETFGTADVNIIVKSILDKAQHIRDCHTEFLGNIPMFMPKNLIQKYIEIIAKNPILK